jgi:cellulose synthase/poly-beta-1,6-N-acetylglucosamine synthase-like glycosyltransferase
MHSLDFKKSTLSVFFLVLARDDEHVDEKVEELNRLGFPYRIICGEDLKRHSVIYRKPMGKYDAINFGLKFVPTEVDVVVFNDVDAEIHGFEHALGLLRNEDVSLVFVKVRVTGGPQLTFYSLLDFLRKKVPVAASGELMLIRQSCLRSLMPLRKCKAEDSYILFKVLEKGGKVAFCEDSYVTTERTTFAEQEEAYKRRTVGGIYQALSMSKPPAIVRLFYTFLPFVSPLLLVMGKKGFYWTKGILLGFVDYARGDRTGSWKPI